MDLAGFVRKYPPRPAAKPSQNADENRLLEIEDGVECLTTDQASNRLQEMNGNGQTKPGTRHGKCLWVFDGEKVPAVLEIAPRVRIPLESGEAKHSNLVRGGAASCGGECWIDVADSRKLWINGGSGRYGPRSEQELADAVSVFATLGYTTVSAGWSIENDVAERVFR